MAPLPLFPTSLVGSYPQPDWLIDKQKLKGRFPPRTRAAELWRVPSEHLEEALLDAIRLAVDDQITAGLDIITDGEACRESYSNHFATALDGIDIDNPGEALDRSGEPVPVPRITGPIKRRHPISVEEVKRLKTLTDRPIKFTVPGPFTMAQQAQNDYYPSLRDAALAYAEAVREEVEDLFSAGADIVQLDEPYMQARPEAAEDYGIDALNKALQDVSGTTCVHICFGYAALIHARPEGYSFLPQLHQACCQQISIETAQSGLDCSVLSSLPDQTILLGVIDLSSSEVESVNTIVDRVERALPYIDKERLVLAPDCGMKYLPREASLQKLSNMVEAAKILRSRY
ncbi:MAG: cobalamin-independent methionine synthase II family protein [Luminiphilus sp.]|jgi:5-methyltetrahydropteroyltriglutamate--homocysteine methyltransferase